MTLWRAIESGETSTAQGWLQTRKVQEVPSPACESTSQGFALKGLEECFATTGTLPVPSSLHPSEIAHDEVNCLKGSGEEKCR